MAMEIQVISDIHLEFLEEFRFEDIVKVSAPYLAICGDLGVPYLEGYDKFLSECSGAFKEVFLIAGNHEYYQWKRKSGETYSMIEVDEEIGEIVGKYKNVHFLNNECFIIGDVAILGSTLWSEIGKENYFNAEMCMNDYKYIYVSRKAPVSAKFISEKFKGNCEWLKGAIEKLGDKKIVVMTHHLPSFRLIHERFKGSKLNCCFASDLEHLMKGVTVWLAGHTHVSFNVKISETSCVVNPKGYFGENPDYDSGLVIKVG
ncbi:MAG: metallophosphatase [Hyperionvirus sp.]|uniref:Metallophosphatase n=1 Tax=Hyperionvirus sp. TaxID=2487770 RepID=A0A3G5A7Z5_9VIRU|nr:MAG: metallophosphatase [Hyperionvirus sp.]